MWEISYSAQSFYTLCLMRADAARARADVCGTSVSFAVTIFKDILNHVYRGSILLDVRKPFCTKLLYTSCLMRADAARAAVCGTSVSFQRYLTVMMPIGVQVFLCVRSYSAQSFYTSCLRALLSVEQAFLLQLQSWRITLIEVQLFLDARKLFCKWIKEKGWRRQRHSQRQGKKGTRWKKVKRENRQIHGSQILNHFLGPMNNKTCDKERKPRVCPAGALPQDCLRWQHGPSSKMPASSVSNFSYVRMVARACWWCSSPSF